VLVDPGAAGDPADDADGAVPVQPAAVRAGEQRSFGALAGGRIDRPGGARAVRGVSGIVTTFPPLRVIHTADYERRRSGIGSARVRGPIVLLCAPNSLAGRLHRGM
jgi:hypothetical protein